MGISSDSKTWVVEWFHNEKWIANSIDDDDSMGPLYMDIDSAKIRLIHEEKEFPGLKHRITNTAPSPVKGDMKAGLTNGKPQLSQLPIAALVYATRAAEYGNSPGKYERGNYLRPTIDTLADFHRLLGYLDASLRHTNKVTTEMNRTLGCTDQTKADLMAGANCIDPESGLPNLCGSLISIMMAIQQAVDAGLIPADPGRPWEKNKTS